MTLAERWLHRVPCPSVVHVPDATAEDLSLDDLQVLRRLRARVRAGAARATREACGLTIADAARHALVSDRSIHRWERQESTPHGPCAVRYGRLLERLHSEGPP